jgi:hypothetical protein
LVEDGDRELDGWLIGALRGHPRPFRLEQLLFEPNGVAAEAGAAPVAARVDALEEKVGELGGRVERVEHELSSPSTVAPMERGHVLFFVGHEGYETVEREEPAPALAEPVEIDGRRYRVEHVGRSPFPGDRRPCLFLVGAQEGGGPAVQTFES